MFEGAFSPMHWLVVLVIALLIFGPKKLPEVGKGLGTAIRGFKEALNAKDEAPAKEDQPAKSGQTSEAK
jgi:sec-independent protein translocase protein TatA